MTLTRTIGATPSHERLFESRTVSPATATAIAVADMIGIGVFTSLGFQVKDLPSGFTLLTLWVASTAAFFFVLNYTASFASLFVLRWREPGVPRPYRAVGYPWVAGLLLLSSVAFLVANVVGDTRNSLRSLALLGISYPVYLAICWRRRVVAEGR